MDRPRRLKFLSPLAIVFLGGVATACLEQYDPSRYKAQEHKEWQQSVQPVPKLTEKGELPAPGEQVVATIDVTYNQLCASCHGQAGDGNGPAGAALNPKPRAFTDATWQASVTDEHIHKVIKDGGVAVGLSPMMAPWGAVLSEQQLTEMVAYVRQFKKG